MTGSIKITLPAFQIVPPSEADSYLLAAEKLYDGVKVLADSGKTVDLAYSFLAAQSLECALKAYLSHKGITEKELKDFSIRHNLEALWSKAVANSLKLSPQPPDWSVLLNSSHDKPYYFRYPIGLNGMSYPNPDKTREGIDNILLLVKASIRKR